MVQKISGAIASRLERMPAWLFWLIFASLTWFYIIRRIIDWDLWWHMAAGRYFLEYGHYPPCDTFSYTETIEVDKLSYAWLGDILFHLAYVVWPTDVMGVFKALVIGLALITGLAIRRELLGERRWLGAFALGLLLLVIAPPMGAWLATICYLLAGAWLHCKKCWPGRQYIPWFYIPAAASWLYLVTRPVEGTFLFGDTISYLTREWGHFGGLQLMTGGFILSGAYFILATARFRLNIWTLLAITVMVIGTTQMHLTKNAIFAIFFMSLMSWMWIQIKFENRRFWVWIYPPILLCWNEMHGYAKMGWLFLLLIFVGEIVDSTIVYARTRKTNFFLVGCLLVAVLVPLMPIDHHWSVLPDFNNVSSSLLQKAGLKEATIAPGQPMTAEAMPGAAAPDKTERLKSMFRIIFSGIDADKVAEYQWPVSNPFVFSNKLVFVLNIFLFFFIVFMLAMFRERFYFSLILPCLAMAYLSLGYLRTVSFPFLCTFIFMAYILRDGLPRRNHEERKKNAIVLCGLTILVLLAYFSSELFAHLIFMFHDGLKHYGVVFVQYLVYPFAMALPVLIGILFIRDDKTYEAGFQHLKTVLGLVVLVNLLAYVAFSNYKYLRNDFHTVSGFLDTEQGVGKSNKFFDAVANYVEKTIPNDRHIFNSYNMGGYLLWKWYGKRKVFIDGRSAIYGGEFYHDYTAGTLGKWIGRYGLEQGIFSMLVDKEYLKMFQEAGWHPVVFDSCLALLQRTTSPEQTFGKIPEFLPGERSLERLEYLDLQALGIFLDTCTRQMMVTGRMKDAKVFITKYADIIKTLPQNFRFSLFSRLRLLDNGIAMFGDINSLELAQLWTLVFNQTAGVEYHKAVGKAAMALQKFDLACQEFSNAYKLDSKDSELVYTLGEAFASKADLHAQNKQFDEAKECYKNTIGSFNQALSLNNNTKYFNRLVVTMMRVGLFKDAREVCNRGINIFPNNHELHFNLGILQKNDKQYEDARKSFQRVLELQPDFEPARQQIDEIEKAAGAAKP